MEIFYSFAKIQKKTEISTIFKKKKLSLQKFLSMRYSIITINYNDKDGLMKTIDSVICQTNTDFEYIIIDGGSTDGSINIIKEHEIQISYWVSEPDKGVYNAMNKGVAQAHGDYLIFMNSGDCFHSSEVLSTFKDYKEDIICGKVLKGCSTKPSGHNKPTITLVDLMRGSLPHQAMFIKRELMQKHLYDEKYRILSDWKFCLEAIVFDNCSFLNSDVIVADYDISGISTNSNGLLPKEREEILKEMFPPRIITDYQRLYPVDDELLEQSLLLTQTDGARKWVKRFSDLVLRLINKK